MQSFHVRACVLACVHVPVLASRGRGRERQAERLVDWGGELPYVKFRLFLFLGVY